MWNPIKITIKNLMSHKDTEYHFKNGKCVMIYGENLSDDGADSNGSGKSVILEAITLSLTNEVSREVNRDEFINDDSDSCFVSLELNNSSGDISKLRIEREIFRNKSAKIKIFENGELNKEITSVNEANKRIFELIGLSKFDLLNFFLIGQDKSFSFLVAGDSDKKDIISRFSNTNFIFDKIEELKAKNKIIEKEIFNFQNSIEKEEDKILFFKNEIDNLKEKKDDSDKSDILKKDISKYKLLISTEEEKIKKKKVEISKLKSSIEDENVLISREKKIKAKIKTLKSDLDDYLDDLSTIKVNIKHYEDVLSGTIQCPKCNEKFLLDSEFSIEDIPDLILEEKQAKELIDLEIESIKTNISNLREKLAKIEDQKEEINSISIKIRKLKKENSISLESISSYGEILSELSESIKKIKKSTNKDKILDLKNSIDKCKIKISENREEFDKKKNEFDNNSFWIHHLGKKGFLTFLTNKSIKSIEGITNFYLQKINTNLQVKIDGFTELKSGDMSDKINISILRDGKSVANYHRFSGGEKGRINISNIVGLQKLINMSCPNGGLNFLGLDEVFEGLDITGQKETIKILEEIGVTTLVVSHRSKPIGVENELIIQKINGISKIIK